MVMKQKIQKEEKWINYLIPKLLIIGCPFKKGSLLLVDQKRADQIFRDINIEVNGFYFMNYLAYWSLRIGGFVAWNGHRKKEKKEN